MLLKSIIKLIGYYLVFLLETYLITIGWNNVIANLFDDPTISFVMFLRLRFICILKGTIFTLWLKVLKEE